MDHWGHLVSINATMTDDFHVAEMSDTECRHHLAALHREGDRRMAEAEHERRALAGPVVRETGDLGTNGHDHAAAALYAAPAAEPDYTFTEAQFEALAEVIYTLRRDWENDIESLQQRLLHTVARLVVPAERSEETVYVLKDRVARIEQWVERQLSEATEHRNLANKGALAERNAALAPLRREVAVLRGENAELKAMLGDVLKQFAGLKSVTGEIEVERKTREATFAALAERLANLGGKVDGRLSQLATVADFAGLLPRGFDAA